MSRIEIEVEANDDPSQKVKEGMEKGKGGSEEYLWVGVGGGKEKVVSTLKALLRHESAVPLLKWLYLGDNKLSEFPMSVLMFVNLERLWLDNNQLTTLPSEILKLLKLKGLSLQNNAFTSIPLSIGQLKQLEKLYVYGELCVCVCVLE